MTELKELAKVESMINQVLADRETQLAVIQEEGVKLEQSFQLAKNEMQTAIESINVEAYKKAKEDYEKKLIEKELYERRLTDLNTKPLISKEEYENAVIKIITEMESVDEHARGEICRLSEEMNDVAIDLENKQDRANKALYNLQEVIYRGADRSRDRNGNIMYLTVESKRINKAPTIDWGKKGVNCGHYKRYTGSLTGVF